MRLAPLRLAVAGLLLWIGLGAGVAAGEPLQGLAVVAPPAPAADFALPGEDGRIYRLSDFRGQVVVLNFWATWCPPCREEMPSMERARLKLRGEKIVILAVNVGESAEQVFEFTGRYPVGFPLLLDTDGVVIERYPVIGLPTTFVIDPLGRITHRAIGGRAWDDDRLLDRLRALLQP